jgi:glycine/D-amino acid oxidase-like deaminating enzyme
MELANISYWEKKHFFKADVIIIGSGIVGLNAAITIKTLTPKIDVIVLEKGFLPTGASTKNAGFACFGSISELIAQEKIAGTDGLHELIAKRWNGLIKLRKLLGDDRISFRKYGGYELFTADQQHLSNLCVSKLSHFNSLIADIVLQKDVYRTADPKIKSFGFAKVATLIENELEAQLDPGQMMKALLAKAMSFGIQLYNNCEVKELKPGYNGVEVLSNQGSFRCKKVLVATNAFVGTLLPSLAVTPGRGQVVLTKPILNLKIKGTFHYDEGFYYFRNIDDRLLLGGGRNLDFASEKTTMFGETPLVQNALKKLIEEMILPDIAIEIEQKWSGIMAFGPQLAPIIEETVPNVFTAVRCNGMGIAIGCGTGAAAGELLVRHL